MTTVKEHLGYIRNEVDHIIIENEQESEEVRNQLISLSNSAANLLSEVEDLRQVDQWELQNEIQALRNDIASAVELGLEIYKQEKKEQELQSERNIAAAAVQGYFQDQAISKLTDPAYQMYCKWKRLVKEIGEYQFEVNDGDELIKYYYPQNDSPYLTQHDATSKLRLVGFSKEDANFMISHLLELGVMRTCNIEGKEAVGLDLKNPRLRSFIEWLGFNWRVD
jgi:hypothetical protein